MIPTNTNDTAPDPDALLQEITGQAPPSGPPAPRCPYCSHSPFQLQSVLFSPAPGMDAIGFHCADCQGVINVQVLNIRLPEPQGPALVTAKNLPPAPPNITRKKYNQ